MILGDAVSKLETFVWILSHISRSITWSLFILKASYLVKWLIWTWSFMWWYQFIDLVKIWNSPQLPDEFRYGQFLDLCKTNFKFVSEVGPLPLHKCLIVPCWGSLEYVEFPMLKLKYFFQYSSYWFLEVFSCQIVGNSNEWSSRNGCISKKVISHSIGISFLTTHVLHLLGCFRWQRKIWELLGSLHCYLS